MLKFIAAIALSLSLIFLVKESVVALRTDPITGPPVSEGRQPRVQTTLPAEKNVLFYPPVPRALPDFNKGYLFNEERMIEGAASEDIGTDEEDTSGLSVDMDTVYYAGSLIIGEERKGLVAYPSPKATPVSRKMIKVKQAAPQAKDRNYAKLAVGDNFSGYKVVELEADRIVFKKGTETIEKMLIDPEKPRIAAPPLPKEKPKTTTAITAKTNRVQLDKAGRPVQSSRTVRRTNNPVPNPKIQVPGVPAPPATE